MKIRKGGEADLKSHLAREQVQRRQNERIDPDQSSRGSAAQEGRVQLGLAKAIQEELNAERLEEERREKVAHIKEAIANGTYNPQSEDVAQALGHELVLEILSRGGAADTEE